jgi:hypothetical protein
MISSLFLPCELSPMFLNALRLQRLTLVSLRWTRDKGAWSRFQSLVRLTSPYNAEAEHRTFHLPRK